MKLSPEDRALVLETRAHHVRMRNDPEGSGERPTSRYCALCRKYNKPDSFCAGCPVHKASGRGCLNTPWLKASDTFTKMTSATMLGYGTPEFVAAFQACEQEIIDWIDEHLLAEEDAPLSDDQQLPSEITKAAEGKRDDG